MQTIFITGASSGLGKATAKLFAEKGWQVIATLRKPEEETELKQMENITLLPLDITDAVQILETYQKAISIADIDVVFNNAAIGMVGPLEAATDEQLERQLNTNLLGTMRVTRAFIPYFREKEKGLFLVTTSFSGFVGTPFSSVLHAAKWALEGWSESMSFELNKLGIGIKTIIPGGIKTNFIPSMDKTSHPAYEQWMEKLQQAWDTQSAHWSDPEQIAEVVFEAATDGKDQLRYFAGEDAKSIYEQRQQMGDEAFRKRVNELFFGE